MSKANVISLVPETYKKIDIRSVTCRSCRLPHTVNENGDCAFCARRMATPAAVPVNVKRMTREQEILMAAIAMTAIATAGVMFVLWLAGAFNV